MTVAILHYHLRRGGVTRVIEGQSQALSEADVRHVVLSGTPYRGSATLPLTTIPELDYPDSDTPGIGAEALLKLTERAAVAELGAAPDLWHIHNHSLGKNKVLSEMVALLARRGDALLLQLHDFAEDGRPDNFLALKGLETLYPTGPRVHYALINSRDRRMLEAAGLAPELAHALPNAVTPPAIEPGDSPSPDPIVLYPVRGIRRKNLGELCLLAAVAPPGARFAVSLAPENKRWRPTHERWMAFARHHKIPVEFGVVDRLPPIAGASTSFESWLSHSTHLMTTSIAEGFGLAFLEPIALGLPLLGRNLPEITRDFTKDGLALGTLYHDLPVPLAMVEQDRLRQHLLRDLARIYESYGRDLPPERLEATWRALTANETIDFGNLPEDFQVAVIAQVLQNPAELAIGTWLRDALAIKTPASPATALAAYGLPAYRKALLAIYEQVLETPERPATALDQQKVLDRFLSPERFHFLRT